MSSTKARASSQSSSEPTTKKKFGKNLNKLTKPPAPPIASSSSSGFDGGPGTGSGRVGGVGGSSRSGLLLLSTKRSSSSGQSASSSSGVGGGLLSGTRSSSAPRQLSSSSLRSDSLTSAHDALLTAAAVAAGRIEQQQQNVPPQPQAWGLGEKQQRQAAAPSAALEPAVAQGTLNQPILAPKGGVSSRYHGTGASNQDGVLERRNHEGSPSVSQPGNAGGTNSSSLSGSSSSQVDKAGSQFRFPDGKQLHSASFSKTNASAIVFGDLGGQELVPRNEIRKIDLMTSKLAPVGSSMVNTLQVKSESARMPSPLPAEVGVVNSKDGADPKPSLLELSVPQQKATFNAGDMQSTLSMSQREHTLEEKSVVDGTTSVEHVGRNGTKMNDEQVKYMSRLAKERAEKKRVEEEARANEQKERAARRLKELEEKLSSEAASSSAAFSSNGRKTEVTSRAVDLSLAASPALDFRASSMDAQISGHDVARHDMPEEKGNRRQRKPENSEIVLERLGRTKKIGNGDSGKNVMTSGSAASGSSIVSTNAGSNGRTLLDPNRTYSSLVGGSNTPEGGSSTKTADDIKGVLNEVQPRYQIPTPVGLHDQMSRKRYAGSQVNTGVGNGVEENPPIPVIQLASYEDRDRGERSSSSGPRMLFDPKSGSMVAVPSREEVSSGSKVGRKNRNKLKNRNGRDRDDSTGAPSVILAKRSDSFGSSEKATSNARNTRGSAPVVAVIANDTPELKSSRRQKGRKDDSAGQRKERKRDARLNVAGSAGQDAPKSNSGFVDDFSGRDSGAVLSTGTKARNNGGRSATGKHLQNHIGADLPRMPRTCGVLYKLDEAGNYVCADGCDADQGYGAHSVPGGRIRNPVAHAQFLELQKTKQQESVPIMSGPVYRHDHHGSFSGYYGDSSLIGAGRHEFLQHQQLDKRGLERFDREQMVNQRMSYYIDYEHKADSGRPACANNMCESTEHSLSPTFARQNQTAGLRSETDIMTFDIPSPLRVRPNERIELLTGAPESPTLQATADPWAPSEAALAAIAAASTGVSSNSPHVEVNSRDEAVAEPEEEIGAATIDLIVGEDDFEVTDEEEDFHGSPSFVGLGFDPTENMDSVMTSPSLRSDGAEHKIDPVGLAGLSLGPSGATESSSAVKNPFVPLSGSSQFLGSSTWGTGGSLTSSPGAPTSLLSNWNILGSHSGDVVSSSVQTSNNAGHQQRVGAAAFLSLSPLSVHNDSKTWGTGGLTLGGTPLARSHSTNSSMGQLGD